MRKTLFLIAFMGAIAAGSIAARGQDEYNLLGFGHTELVLGIQNSFQVRMQQRVIVRVPRYRVTTASVAVSGKSAPRPATYKEEKTGKCMIMDRFVASRPGPGPKESLELVTREGALIRAYLGNGCLARDFYAGAYMERPADGKLCVDRDMLFARTGAKCEIDKFRALVLQ